MEFMSMEFYGKPKLEGGILIETTKGLD